MSSIQPASIVSELRSIRSRSSRPNASNQAPLPIITGGRYHHPSVVRYFDSLTDASWGESDSEQHSAHSEPEYASDVEVLVVHREASHQDLAQSSDKTYRKLLDMFDWDAMKMPVDSDGEEPSSGEETDSADEMELSQPAATVVLPWPKVIIIPAQSVVRHVQYVVSRSDLQTTFVKREVSTRSKLVSNEGKFIIERGNLRHPTIRTVIKG